MADQLYLSYRLRGFTANNMLRHYERLLRGFPFSKLSRATSILRILAVSLTEPVLNEAPFESPPDVGAVLVAAKEFLAADCALMLETSWDLWQYEEDWHVLPVRVTLSCFGPDFENGSEDHLRIDFGIDTHFLPQPDIPQSAFMMQSNVRSLLHLVHQLDGSLSAENRRLWTESGENFAAKLQSAAEASE